MIDIKQLRTQPEQTAEALKKRGFELDLAQFSELERKRKALQTELEQCQSERNQISKKIGQLKQQQQSVAADIQEQAERLAESVTLLQEQLGHIREELQRILETIPNIPHPSVPVGSDESANTLVKKVAQPPVFHFNPRDHTELGERLQMMDFDMAAKLSGSRFVVMSRDIARMHRALSQMMLDLHTQEHGYVETMVPFIVHARSLFGTGQLPKFKEDVYQINNAENHYLIPTAEVPLTCLAASRIIPIEELPMRFVSHTPCFRSEAGSHGRDTRGMIRQHQFEKVELVHIVAPEGSYETLELLLSHAEEVLKRLQLSYRVVTLSTGDMGFSAAKTYDIEVWMPSQKTYREISSCSNTEAFQARRMKARMRRHSNAQPELIHTLNGSGLAVGRTLIALMENFQNEDGSISVPDVLQPYMNGQKCIEYRGD